MKKTEKIEQ